jgi:hypothetical protein
LDKSLNRKRFKLFHVLVSLFGKPMVDNCSQETPDFTFHVGQEDL